MIKPQTKQLSSMFCLRGLFCFAKDLCLVAVLLCAIFVLVTCKKCSLDEAQSRLELDACKLYMENFDTSFPDVFDGHVRSELRSRHSVKRHGLENICPDSNSFCFPSTLTGFLLNDVSSESKATDAPGVESEGFLSGLMQVRSNLSRSPEHGMFRLSSGRVISCSSDFHELPSTDISTKNGEQNDVSSYMSTLYDHEAHRLKSRDNVETVNSGFRDGFSTPPLEIKPLLLDWETKNMYHPSPAFFTVKNLDTDNVLSIYDPYSSNSQFYPCNFSEISLAPGEIASICFIFSPTKLGLSAAKLVLQTSFGGFLIQAKGFAVESPYLVKPLSGFDISPGGKQSRNFSLFNPFSENLYVEKVTAWISISSGSTSCTVKAICRIHSFEDSSRYKILNTDKWLDLGSAEDWLPQILIRRDKSWEVGPQETGIIMELNMSEHFEGKIVGAFCVQFLRSSDNKTETIMVPLEAELSPISALDTNYISVSLEALVPCNTNGSVDVALSVRNDAPYVLSVTNVRKVGESTENFQVKSTRGLVLFPRSIMQVAILSYADLETLESNMNCKLLIQINDTRSSPKEIPCMEVISVFSRCKLDSAVGYAHGISSVDYLNSRERSISSGMQLPSDIKAVDTREADELVLKNWKSQATTSSISVLEDKEVLFPIVHVGNHSSQWITIKNPTQEPIMVQLILNSGEVIDNCRTDEMHLQPSSSSILAGNRSIAPTRYGFSIAKDAITEAFIHPHGNASLGPILFHPSNRCEWRSSALVRNNLSGVEWFSLRGFGGLLSLVLLEGTKPVQSLEFKLNSPSLLNFSSLEYLNLHLTGAKSPSCSHPLIKEVNAKNMGDFPLEVKRIEVSGSECGLDGFLVRNCKGFRLPPGESLMLQISYRSDFSAATMQRDLELALATGILVIPMKASLPLYLLNFCKRSIFWMRLKKAIIVIVFAAALSMLLVCLLFPRVTAFSFHDFKSRKNYSNVRKGVKSLSVHLNGKNGGDMPPKMDRFVRSILGDEALLLKSAGGCPDDHALDPEKQKNSLMENLPETRIISSVLSNSSPVENLRVRIGKDKGRRRRKKKSQSRVPGLFEVSSSQSGNSTPSSPLSPAASVTPKRPSTISPDTKQQSTEARNPFAQAPDQQRDNQEFSKPSSKIKILDNEVSSKRLNDNNCSSSTRKLAGRAVLLPSATFPSAGRATPPWTCHSPSTSAVAPHARAPGTKLHVKKGGEVGETMDMEEKFTYSIWGDHLFGLPSTYQLKPASNMPTPSTENNSESFFVREPQAFMKSTLLKNVSCNLEGNNK